MKFRIKYLPQIGYFSQVKRGFIKWNTIGKHMRGYGLYAQAHVDNPLQTEHDARALCKLYEQWAVLSENTATFIDV
jgi:hypothetical protein